MSSIAKRWICDLPVYEPGKPIEELARELGCEGARDIDKLASNENPLGPSRVAIRAVREAASRMHLYPDGSCHCLHEAIARKLSVKPEQVLAGNGSNELLEFIGHVFLDDGSNVVVAEHTFSIYRIIAAMFRARVIAVPMRDFTHDLDAMLAAITPDTKVVFIANPNNPTGTMVYDAAIARFMAAVPDHATVCFDEAYIDLVARHPRPDVLGYVREGRNAIVLRTFSKSHGLAGLRVGYAVAPEECIGLMHRVRQPFNVNSLAQAGALAALNDDAHVAKTRDVVAKGLAFFEKHLASLGLEFVPASANFMLVKVGDGGRVAREMERRRVIVRQMDGCGLPEYIRISIGLPSENRRCVVALASALGIGAP